MNVRIRPSSAAATAISASRSKTWTRPWRPCARGVSAFVPAESYPEGAERRVAFILDPEGNVIEFSHPLPRVAR